MIAKFVRRLTALALPLSLIVLAVAFKTNEPALIEQFRASIFDTYQRVKPRAFRSSQLRIVAIDEASLQAAGQWPWERRTLAQLIDRLREMGAAAIGLDMMFLEPDRTSPALMFGRLPDLPAVAEFRQRMSDLPDYDVTLAEAVGRGRVTLGHVLLDQPLGPPTERRGAIVLSGPNPLAGFHGFVGALSNLAPISSAAEGGGALNVVPDPDGVVRRVPLLLRIRDEIVPSFAAEVLRVAESAQSYVLRTGAADGGAQLRIGRVAVPIDPGGELTLYYSG